MKLNINENKYNVKKKKIFTDSYQLTITPKKRNCKLCNKTFSSTGKEFLTWTDDKGFLRSGYFCKKDFILIKKVLKEIR